MVKGVVVTHGNLGRELIDTARRVIGDFEDCHAVSNHGKTPDGLYAAICDVVGPEDVPCVIFVDFFGSSCGHGSMRLENERENAVVISGVNLPMLLAFLNKRDDVPFEALARIVIERSHDSIRLLDTSKL